MNNLDKFLKKYFTDLEREYIVFLKGTGLKQLRGFFLQKKHL